MMKKLLVLISLLSNLALALTINWENYGDPYDTCTCDTEWVSDPNYIELHENWSYTYIYLHYSYCVVNDYRFRPSSADMVGDDLHVTGTFQRCSTAPICSESEIIVNNECVPKTQIDCKAEHGFDWVTDDAVDASACGSKVDGVVIDAGTWHDPDTSHNVGVCCLHTKNPNYDCSLKGVGWQGVQADSIDDCLSKADNILFDSATVESGDTISTTCCVHAIDNGEIHTPTTDEGNDTTPMKNDSESIKNAVDNGTNQAHEDANQAHQDAVSNGNQAHEDANQAHQDAVSNGNQAHEDAFAQQTSLNYIGQSIDSLRTESSLSASNIKDSIDGVSEDIGNLDNTLQGDPTKTPESELSNSGYGGEAITDFIQGLSTQLSSLGGRLSSAPHVQPSTVGCVESVDTSYGVFSLDVGSMADTLASPLSLLWSLLLIYFNFKIYLFIFFKLIERV